MQTSTEAAWQQALETVFGDRSTREVADIAEVAPETVRRWLRGERVPSSRMWGTLLVKLGPADQRDTLCAARNAVARKSPGRPRLAKAVRVERLRRQLEEAECQS